MNIKTVEVHEKYHRVELDDGFVEIVRRDSKFTSGHMSVGQMVRLDEIETYLEQYDGNI